ncbi:tRNA1(Val) (adenine(37)-N6)-methyltransferase [Sulfurimonas sp.]|uniref:tRNA1(Val) (adenine(37)-N6)-methyltransferase n=1 Tax=Sulfurimonas sp. TaxID=2022749 RepID=UPI002AB0EC21|nr:methyltransferase [Sulfurimonas sp.]
MLLYQPHNGYCYNSDSLFLYDFINSFNPRGKILDVGAGCGIVGLLVARDNEKVNLEAVEKQDIFVSLATINARVNKIKYKIKKTDILEYDEKQKYDFIISNPPFYNQGSKQSKNNILFNARYNVNLPIDKFFKKITRLLKPQGHFIFCYEASQFFLVCAELDKVKLRVVDVRFVHSRLDKKASLVLIHARNSSKSLMNVLSPLITMKDKNYTKEVEEIFKKASTQSIKCQL